MKSSTLKTLIFANYWSSVPSQRYRYQKTILQHLIFFLEWSLCQLCGVSTPLSKFGYPEGLSCNFGRVLLIFWPKCLGRGFISIPTPGLRRPCRQHFFLFLHTERLFCTRRATMIWVERSSHFTGWLWTITLLIFTYLCYFDAVHICLTYIYKLFYVCNIYAPFFWIMVLFIWSFFK